MSAILVLPEGVARQNGTGADFALGAERGKPLLLTLGITRIIQQESLEVSVWGSADAEHWHMLQIFPQKFYCGTYSMLLDLSRCPEVRYLRAQWMVNSWGPGEMAPLFGFYLSAEVTEMRAAGVA